MQNLLPINFHFMSVIRHSAKHHLWQGAKKEENTGLETKEVE